MQLNTIYRTACATPMLALLLCLTAGAFAEVAEIDAPAPGETGAALLDGLDTYTLPITTTSEEAQAWFNQGLVLLYGFNHGEAIRSFRRAAELDPEAAMPWWGITYANGMHINLPEMSEA